MLRVPPVSTRPYPLVPYTPRFRSPFTLSVITTSFPRDQQAKAIGTWAGFAGAGGILGLFVSAALIDNVTWPWVFALPVALAVVSFLATAAFVPNSVEHAEAGFDVLGSRSEEHTSELQSLMRISYAVFCLK